MAKTRLNNKVVIYARKSKGRMSDISESCDTQIEYCEKYAEFHKLEVIAVFRDDSISGVNTDNRPGFQQAVFKATKKQTLLMVYSLSRLSRNTRETLETVDKLLHAKADLCSVSENIDTSSAMGKMFYRMLAIMAEWERDVISERTSDAMIRHQRNGRRMSSLPPYGWAIDRDDPAKMTKDPYEQNIIDLCLEWRAEGDTLLAICAKLKKQGYKPRAVREKRVEGRYSYHAGKWTHDKINRILYRERLLGRT